MLVVLVLGIVAVLWRGPIVEGVLQSWSRANLNGTLRYRSVSVGLHQVTLNDVALVEADGTVPLQASRLTVSLDFSNLLRARSFVASVSRIDLEAPYLSLILRQDGTFNVPGFIKPSKVPGPPIWAHGQFGGLLAFHHARMDYQDQMHGGFTTSFSDVEGFADARQGPLLFEAKGLETATKGTFAMRASLDDARQYYQMRATFDGVSLNRWGAYLLYGQPVHIGSGLANLDATVSGLIDSAGRPTALPDVVLTGRFWNAALSIRGLPLSGTGLSGRLSATADLLRLDDVTGSIGPVAVRLDGRLFRLADPQLSLVVQVRPADVHRVLALLPQRIPLDVRGVAEGRLDIGGSLHQPMVEGTVTSPRLWVMHRRLQDVYATFRYLDQGLRIERVTARYGGGTLAGSGWVFPRGNRVWLTLTARGVSLQGLVPGVNGDASGRVLVLGNASRPVVSGRGQVSGGVLQGHAFEQAAGRFNYYNGSVFLGQGRVTLPQGEVETTGGYLDTRTRQATIALHGSGVDLPGLAGFSQVQGRLDFDLNVAGSLAHPIASGTVHGGQVSWNGLTLSGVNVAVESDGETAVTPGGRAMLDGSPVYFDGTALLNPLAVDATIVSPWLPMGDLPLPVKLHGGGPLTAHLRGSPAAGFAFAADATTGQGRFVSSGYATADGDVQGVVMGRGVVVGGVVPAVRGRADVDATVAGTIHRVRVDYAVRGRGLTVAGLPIADGTGGVDTGPGGYVLTPSLFQGPYDFLSIQGTPGARLTVAADVSDLGQVQRHLDVPGYAAARHRLRALGPLTGRARISGVVRGPLARPTFAGFLSVPNASLSGEDFALSGPVSLDPSRLQTSGLVFTQNEGTIRAQGEVALHPIRFDMAIDGTQVDLPGLLRFTPLSGLASQGRADVRLMLRGTPDNPLLSGTVGMDYVRLLDQDFSRVDAHLATSHNQLVLDRLTAQVPGGTIEGHGTVSAGPEVDFTLGAHALPVSSIDALRNVARTQQLAGQADVQAHVHGHPGHFVAELAASATDLKVHGQTLKSVSVRATADAAHLHLDPLSVSGPTGTLLARGDVAFPQHRVPFDMHGWLSPTGPRFDMAATLTDLDVRSLLDLLPPAPADAPWTVYTLARQTSGRFSGNVTLQGTLARPTVAFQTQGTGVGIARDALGDLTARGLWSRTELRLDRLDFKGPSGAGNASLVWNTTDGVHGQAHVTNLDLGGLAPALPHTLPVGGTLTGNVALSGSSHAPELVSDFQVAHGVISHYRFDTLTGRVTSHQDVLTLDHITGTTAGHQVVLNGTIPYRYEGGHWVSPAPMSVDASAEENDLGLLSLLLPDVQGTGGQMTVNVHAGGTFAAPQVSGNLAVTHGIIRLSQLTSPIENLEVKATLAGRTATINQLTGSVGRGTFQGGGTVAIDPNFSATMDLFLKGTGLEFEAPRYLGGRTDVDLHLVGSSASPLLSGTVTTSGGTLQLPTRAGTAVGSSFDPLQGFPTMDVDLTLVAKDVTATVLDSTVHASGKVTLAGKTPAVRPQGRVAATSGVLTVPLVGSFTVRGGSVTWDGSTWLPFVSLHAENNFSGYEVFVTYRQDLSQPGDNPMTLTSSPPLSQPQILALLTGQTPQTTLGQAPGPTTTSLGNLYQGAQYSLLAAALQPLGRALSLTAVTVEPIVPNSYAVKIARALDPMDRLLFTLTQVYGQPGQALQIYGLEYHPRPNFQLRVGTGTNSYEAFFVQYTRRY